MGGPVFVFRFQLHVTHFSCPKVASIEAAFAAHPNREKPDSTGSGCGGTGIYKSTYNSDRKWDRYGIGSRRDGSAPGEVHSDGEDGFTVGGKDAGPNAHPAVEGKTFREALYPDTGLLTAL